LSRKSKNSGSRPRGDRPRLGFDEADRVSYEHIYWDHSTLLVQVGILDPALLPVAGAEQAKRLLDPTQPANEMIDRMRLDSK
jgi:carboxymethylenebutenolidase